jgi:hypothetical protein
MILPDLVDYILIHFQIFRSTHFQINYFTLTATVAFIPARK